MSSTADPTVPGRSCGECTLCCKVMGIVALDKPMGQWCRHCGDHGCTIYTDRPSDCRIFYCGFLTTAALGEEWRPSKSKIILVYELNGDRIAAYVDPQRPDAWKREPYYSTLKHWSRQTVPKRCQVIVANGRHIIAVLPDREVDLGMVGPDDVIITQERRSPSGTVTVETLKLHKSDPRLAR